MTLSDKRFWGPWVIGLSLAALMILVGGFVPTQAGAQAQAAAKAQASEKVASAKVVQAARTAALKVLADVKVAKLEISVPASMAYVDVRAMVLPSSQPAVTAVKGPDDASGLWDTLRTALKGKNWSLAVAAALALLVLLLRLGAGKMREYLPVSWAEGHLNRLLAWCGTDRGGAVMVLLSGVLAGVVNGRAAGKPLSVDLVFESLNIAAASATSGAGLYVLVKKLFWPSDKPAPTPATTT
jgi:hypothetical protein